MSETPPTPDGLPFLGNAWLFSRNPIRAMETWAAHGDVVRLEIPGQSWYLVTHPSLIEQVLVEQADSFSIGPAQRESFEEVEDHAITTTTGDRWKRLRRALSPAFTRDSIERYGDRMAERTATVADGWGDGEAVDLHLEMRQLTVHILADVLLNVDPSRSEHVVMDASDALLDRADFGRPGQALPDWIPTPTDRRFEQAVRALDEYVDGILSERPASGGGDDVCATLLAAEDRGELSPEEVRHNVVALLLAGHESPGLALTYAWYLLSDHPDVRESLVREYEAVVDGERPEGESFEDLERTRNVISETLRLYPPTTGVNRQATEPVTLGDYELPDGAQLLIPQWVPHRDERFWDDPASFDPSRWRADADRPDYAYFPFSGGPRNCIGAQFARRELTLALATMVGRVEMDVSVDDPLTFRPTIALRPEQEMTATVHRR